MHFFSPSKLYTYNTSGDNLTSLGIKYWRELILENILIVISIFGFFACIIGVYASIVKNLWEIAIVDSLLYILILLMASTKLFSYRVKTFFVLSGLILLSLILLFILGPYGAGLIYLMGFSVIAAILLGLRGAIYSLLIETVVLIFIALGIHGNWFQGFPIQKYEVLGWVAVGINLLVIGSISSVPLAILVDGLKKTITNQEKLKIELEKSVTELKIAKEKAEESDKLKSVFLANMSHEIRTPLNAIQGFSELIIQNGYIEHPNNQEYKKIIHKNVAQLISTVENILDISLLETKQMKFNKRVVHLDGFYQQISKEYEPIIEHLGYQRVIFEPSIIDPSNHVYIDSFRIKQVISNLISNAIKFSTQGDIFVGLDINKGMATFWVKDQGPGIPNEKQQFIFDRFTQINQPLQSTTGTGLGLAICKGIIEANDGVIEVTSEIGIGSTFYFSIPLISNSNI